MNIVKYQKVWLGVSVALTALALVAMVSFDYRLGIDFAGGTQLEVAVSEPKPEALAGRSLETVMAEEYHGITGQETVAQVTGEGRYLLKSKFIENDQKNAFLDSLRDVAAQVEELRFETVSPIIGGEIVRKAIFAAVLAVVLILLYLAYAFRRVPRPTSSWQFGIATVVALLHDVIVVLGVYAVLGHYFGAEIDSMFMTAMLTLIGFSVHDSIVTFDRLRENLIRHGGEQLETRLNDSITETLVRSINTSFTVVLVLLAMVLMGGQTIFFFSLTLLIGVVVGTYSSIFVASMVWLLMQKKGGSN